jgi:hypothetical protein
MLRSVCDGTFRLRFFNTRLFGTRLFGTRLFGTSVARRVAEPIQIGLETFTGNEKVDMAVALRPQTQAHIRGMTACAGPGQLESAFDDVVEPLHFNPALRAKTPQCAARTWVPSLGFRGEEN